jgi:hypothetical protein
MWTNTGSCYGMPHFISFISLDVLVFKIRILTWRWPYRPKRLLSINKYITPYLVVLDGTNYTLSYCYQHNGMDSNEYNINLYRMPVGPQGQSGRVWNISVLPWLDHRTVPITTTLSRSINFNFGSCNLFIKVATLSYIIVVGFLRFGSM